MTSFAHEERDKQRREERKEKDVPMNTTPFVATPADAKLVMDPMSEIKLRVGEKRYYTHAQVQLLKI